MKFIKIHFSVILMLFSFVFLSAQITLNISSIPLDTQENDSIYVSGNFNGWNPKDSNYLLQKINGMWSVEIPENLEIIEFKFTRGDWSKVEGNHEGGKIENRKIIHSESQKNLKLEILSWEKPEKINQTSSWNVSLLHEEFYIPQLNRYRKIWIYLPPDYKNSNKFYPVIYMHDGQNLFDQETAFSGEWKIDETLNKLFEQGDYGVIVIGIENGGEHRLDEYSLWKNEQYGGGEGDLYIEFIQENLKPYIDENFRTKPQPESTAMIGSSMGGLISTYAGLKFPSTFGKIAAISPSYWFALEEISDYVLKSQQEFGDLKVYFGGSRNESESLESNILTIKNAWMIKGLKEENIQIKIDDYGGHNEAYWAGEFEKIYTWLFIKN